MCVVRLWQWDDGEWQQYYPSLFTQNSIVNRVMRYYTDLCCIRIELLNKCHAEIHRLRLFTSAERRVGRLDQSWVGNVGDRCVS